MNSPTFRIMREKQSFIGGVASIGNFFGNENEKYHFDKSERDADENSILADWIAIGNDMRESIAVYDKKIATK